MLFVVVVNCSVSQGSVLGQRLFILYTANLASEVAAAFVRMHMTLICIRAESISGIPMGLVGPMEIPWNGKYCSSSVGMGKSMGMAWCQLVRMAAGMKTLHLPISHLISPHLQLRERPVLEKSDPI